MSRIFQSRVCEAGTGLPSPLRGDGECGTGSKFLVSFPSSSSSIPREKQKKSEIKGQIDQWVCAGLASCPILSSWELLNSLCSWSFPCTPQQHYQRKAPQKMQNKKINRPMPRVCAGPAPCPSLPSWELLNSLCSWPIKRGSAPALLSHKESSLIFLRQGDIPGEGMALSALPNEHLSSPALGKVRVI